MQHSSQITIAGDFVSHKKRVTMAVYDLLVDFGCASILIIIVFAAVGVNGFDVAKSGGGKATVKRLIGFEMYRQTAFFLQLAVPIAVTLLIFRHIWPDLNPGFGILLASGFDGGHGTAAAVGKSLQEYGWNEAMDLAITFATAGILVGIFGGLILIKIATKKGWTNYVKDFSKLSPDLKTGLVPKEKRNPVGMQTISPVSLDTLCFHMSLVMIIAGGAGDADRGAGHEDRADRGDRHRSFGRGVCAHPLLVSGEKVSS
jgi:ESS family glutamate:Na+ symporter